MLGRLTIAALVLASGEGCAKARPVVDGRHACASWEQDIQPAFTSRCGACHSSDAPAAGYALTSYLGVLGTGSDTIANAIAGDPDSRLLRELDPQTASGPHAGYADLFPRVQDWVLTCALALSSSGIHPAGIIDPTSEDFHGKWLQRDGYKFSVCKDCHGEDFAGGKADVACTTCHAQGPTSCDTCHALPPPSNAHTTHSSGGALGKKLDCSECHTKPTTFDQPGHIYQDDGMAYTGPPVIAFGALAQNGGHAAVWDADAQSCTVYCHAPVPDEKALHPMPNWTHVGSGEAACGSCHGLPPADHASSDCANCHGAVVNSAGALIDTARHLDGHVSLGDESGTCSACHGNADSPAPIGAGLHASHVFAHNLRGPIACSECHLLPSAVTSPGHIDSPPPAEVFPAPFAGLAAADGATPTWDKAADTCTSYCHGDSLKNKDASPGRIRTVGWANATPSAQACGACHGIPPIDAAHATGSIGPSQCMSCHPATLSGFDPSTHIDGIVEVHTP
jgi:predicted CxxxxCH...CXXCH cytochrome family protein